MSALVLDAGALVAVDRGDRGEGAIKAAWRGCNADSFVWAVHGGESSAARAGVLLAARRRPHGTGWAGGGARQLSAPGQKVRLGGTIEVADDSEARMQIRRRSLGGCGLRVRIRPRSVARSAAWLSRTVVSSVAPPAR